MMAFYAAASMHLDLLWIEKEKAFKANERIKLAVRLPPSSVIPLRRTNFRARFMFFGMEAKNGNLNANFSNIKRIFLACFLSPIPTKALQAQNAI